MIARDMETDQLEAFDRVVREGSFSRAAIGLGIGQPAVSARIQSLEEAVARVYLSQGWQFLALGVVTLLLAKATRALTRQFKPA